ncbi:DUF3649 domain-containing protein [Pseudomonas matsuisoli]|jgi:hypothetical protein|uniref:DUF3649 domain-containing protein n=1 Tax=Pseudomonas matsuisoli TaxID=1515666 RepID=A0A917PTN8_9PSED|nr:DUF3649 domain-containing protein [Pseudomonas matsuisoli]GGJ91076.1 hypothetical protein GCM10009304_15980 [Pseudomonas matsuisoli]
MKTKTLSWRYRGAVLSRALAAIFGGYALAAAFAVCMARALPLERSEAVLAGAIPSFLVYCAAVVWVFATRTAFRAWVGVLVPTFVLAAIAWLLGAGGNL